MTTTHNSTLRRERGSWTPSRDRRCSPAPVAMQFVSILPEKEDQGLILILKSVSADSILDNPTGVSRAEPRHSLGTGHSRVHAPYEPESNFNPSSMLGPPTLSQQALYL